MKREPGKRAEMVPAGAVITCPNCSDKIAVFKVPLRPGETFLPYDLEMLQEGHEAGGPLACRICGEAFGRQMIHTEEGWR